MATIGRPTKITPDAVVKLEEMFRIDATVDEACSQAGVDPSNYHRRCRMDEPFRLRMEQARAFPFLVAKKVIIKAINEGNGELALKVLKSRQRELYYEKGKLDVTSNLDDVMKTMTERVKKQKELLDTSSPVLVLPSSNDSE